MPKRLEAAIRAWVRARESAPRAGSTGTVPKGRVNWPSPLGRSASRSTGSSISCWCGATSPPSSEAPAHAPTSWAVFSSSVMASISASTRAVTGAVGSFQREGAEGLSAATSAFTFLLRPPGP